MGKEPIRKLLLGSEKKEACKKKKEGKSRNIRINVIFP